jgi:hypothetical protein
LALEASFDLKSTSIGDRFKLVAYPWRVESIEPRRAVAVVKIKTRLLRCQRFGKQPASWSPSILVVL